MQCELRLARHFTVERLRQLRQSVAAYRYASADELRAVAIAFRISEPALLTELDFYERQIKFKKFVRSFEIEFFDD
jgi:hypothetical protein